MQYTQCVFSFSDQNQFVPGFEQKPIASVRKARIETTLAPTTFSNRVLRSVFFIPDFVFFPDLCRSFSHFLPTGLEVPPVGSQPN